MEEEKDLQPIHDLS